jgi:hypothetical protein
MIIAGPPSPTEAGFAKTASRFRFFSIVHRKNEIGE